jgi:hypothetical protein
MLPVIETVCFGVVAQPERNRRPQNNAAEAANLFALTERNPAVVDI